MDKSVGSRIKSVREKSGLNQKDFGRRLGVSLPTINRVENNHRLPDVSLVVRMFDEFGCDLKWLLTGKDDSVEGGESVPIIKEVPEDFSSVSAEETSGHLCLPGLPSNAVAIQATRDEMVPIVRPSDYVIFKLGEVHTGALAVVRDRWKNLLVRRLVEDRGCRLFVAEDPDARALREQDVDLIGPVVDVLRLVEV